jgi:vacuolar-type H+-ATPase catalytic subunit A/Vma1
MTFIAQTIAKVLADEKPAQHVNRRHPDWGAIAVKTGRALGIEEQAVKALQAAEMDKYVSNLKSDAFGEMVMRLVRQPMTVDAAHFAELIKREYGEDYYRRAGWNPVKVGKSIERLSESLKILYQLSKKFSRGKAIYSLAPSQMMLDELQDDTSASAPSNSKEVEVNSSNSTTYADYGEEDDVFEIL